MSYKDKFGTELVEGSIFKILFSKSSCWGDENKIYKGIVVIFNNELHVKYMVESEFNLFIHNDDLPKTIFYEFQLLEDLINWTGVENIEVVYR